MLGNAKMPKGKKIIAHKNKQSSIFYVNSTQREEELHYCFAFSSFNSFSEDFMLHVSYISIDIREIILYKFMLILGL